MTFLDAHNHLHDTRLAPHRAAIFRELALLPLRRAVVNGTRESDWPAVAALAAAHPWITPSFGSHPWFIAERTPEWRENLARVLDAHPAAGVGEIGLDRWIEGHDLAAQAEIFTAQLAMAAARDRPVTIHCLKAWGALQEILGEQPLSPRGFLLHSYGGPAEMVADFVKRGAFFSFSAYFLHERKAAQREVFRQIPLDRLLVETDAPDMLPPAGQNIHPLPDLATYESLNHPANIELVYAEAAALRGLPPQTFAAAIEENFAKLFG